MPSTIPPFRKTWIVEPNVTALTSFANWLLILKNKIVGYGNRIDGSSNGSTAGMDGVDRWATAADVVLGNEAATTPSAWTCIRLLATGAQLLLHRHGGDHSIIRVYMSPSGSFTGGSTTARPTAPDCFPDTAANAQRELGTSSAYATTQLHFLRSTDGKNYAIWGARVSAPPFHSAHHLMAFGDVADFNTEWYSPSAFFCNSCGGSNGHSWDTMVLGGGGVWASLYAASPYVLPTVRCVTPTFSDGVSDFPVWRAGAALAVINGLDQRHALYDPLVLNDEVLPGGRQGVWPDFFPTPFSSTTVVDDFPEAGSPLGSKLLKRVLDLAIPWGIATDPLLG